MLFIYIYQVNKKKLIFNYYFFCDFYYNYFILINNH